MSLLRFSALVLFSLLFVSAISEGTLTSSGGEDPLIRQVVDGKDLPSSNPHLLSAEHHFLLFKKKYGKTYSCQGEHDYRFKVFQRNLRRAERHQKLDPSAVHGVTQFSDLTQAEFKRKFLGLRRLGLPTDANQAPILPTDDLPTDFDWREKGAVTAVKNQVFFTINSFLSIW
uniref:Cathepsin propeptide inhibitor domain-containing protein n=1 Tax=Rhizophora mucronata TaxID=61149 RepID=A0A2P2JQH5_RHIMU